MSNQLNDQEAMSVPVRPTEALLSIEDLHVAIGDAQAGTSVIEGVSLSIDRGETVAIVGESGSGKSLTALATMGLLPSSARVTRGQVRFDGRDLLGLSESGWCAVRGARIAMIFQDPLTALNPCLTVGYQIVEMFRRHQGFGRRAAFARAAELMDEVGIPDAARRVRSYPHEFSGGMRQRIMIAMALALRPRLLIADEPTTALDVTVQAQILRLLRQRREQDGLALVLISHDLGVVARTAEKVAVMYAGRIVEWGPVAAVYSRPGHPYTRGLMSAAPVRGSGRRLVAIDGQPPDPSAKPPGCPFHPRCRFAQDLCRTRTPELRLLENGQRSACHFAEQILQEGPGDD